MKPSSFSVGSTRASSSRRSSSSLPGFARMCAITVSSPRLLSVGVVMGTEAWTATGPDAGDPTVPAAVGGQAGGDDGDGGGPTFADLGLRPELLTALGALGYEEP